ncbi:MAG: PIN domain-containing protein [Kiritimatiellaeota bacterium]|nr:PIN domain-containing protein [Kiritimatiellota bacterium]
MKRLSDVNVLLTLASDRCRQHDAIKDWWARLPQTESLCICRHVQTSLLRLLCTEAVMGVETLTLPQAWSVYAQLLASGRFTFALEPLGLDATWAAYCRPFGRSPKVVMDAYLAAFAVAGGYRLVTLDKAFGQFKGLDWEYPM